MDSVIKILVKNFARALGVNVIRLATSTIMVLALPKLISVEAYSYWQLYLFYLTFVVFSSLGWCEGLYLKYGGKTFTSLDASELSGQFWAMAGYEVLLCAIVGCILYILPGGGPKRLILGLAFVSALLDILRYSLQMVLQATNCIKEYARIASSERLLFLCFACVAVFSGFRDFVFLIAAELVARVLSLIYAMIVCRRIVFARLLPPIQAFAQIKGLVRIGYKLLLASFVSQFIIGIVRFAIERHFGTIVFGKISLTLSISNIMITCIGAAAIVLFPALTRMQPEELWGLYPLIRTTLVLPILAFLLLYAPLNLLLNFWLPNYAQSLQFLSIVLPICVYETRSFILTDTYFKLYGQTRSILLINVAVAALSAAMTAATVYLMENLYAAVLSIFLLAAIKSTLGEFFICRQNGTPPYADMAIEFLLSSVFILVYWLLPTHTAAIVYLICFAAYVMLRRKQFCDTFFAIRNLNKSWSQNAAQQ